MDSISIGIITRDPEYGKVLGKCISLYHRDIIVTLYTEDDIEKMVSIGHDVCIYDSGIVPEDEISTDIILYEKEFDVNVTGDIEKENSGLWRYEKVPNIVREIIYRYEKKNGRNVGRRDKAADIYGMISASGGAGCSSVAWASLQEFRRFHNLKTCYISLESFESTGNFVRLSGNEKPADEYLYRVMMSSTDCFDIGQIESFIAEDDYGTEAFVPFRGKNKLAGLDSDELYGFLEKISDCGRYDVIVIDYGTFFSEAAVKSFKMCRKLCMVSDCRRREAKSDKLKKYIHQLSEGEYEDKIIYVKNKAAVFGSDDNSSQEMILPYSKESFIENDIIRVTLDGQFGEGIKDLVIRLIAE